MGRSRGGLSTKIHAACDSHGNPLRFILTGGSCADYDSALALLEGLPAEVVIADWAWRPVRGGTVAARGSAV